MGFFTVTTSQGETEMNRDTGWMNNIRGCRTKTRQTLDSLARALGMTATRLWHIEQDPDKAEITDREFKALAHYRWLVERWEQTGEAASHWGGAKPQGWQPRFLLWRLRPGQEVIRDVVAQGIIWQDGTVNLRWLAKPGATTGSVAHYASWLDFAEVHLHDEPRTLVLYYGNGGAITTPLTCPYSGRQYVHRKFFKDRGHGPEAITASLMRSRVEKWKPESQVNAELMRPPFWYGSESIRVTLVGDELMSEGGAADFDFFEVEVTGETEFTLKRGGHQIVKDLETLSSLVDGAPEANDALRRIATHLGRGW